MKERDQKFSTTAKSTEEVVELPLEEIDTSDDAFCFRMNLSVKSLTADIEKNGQDFPVVVRPAEAATYQLVCGFRRVAALKELERETVKAIVRDLSDDDAYRLSWAENQERKSYSELDRANAILKAHRAGKKLKELEKLFGLQKRQLIRLEQIAKMPASLKRALDEDKLTTSHAVVLLEGRRLHPNLKLRRWIRVIEEEGLSVKELRQRIRRENKSDWSEFYSVGEDAKIRLRSVTVDAMRLNEQEMDELTELLVKIDALLERASKAEKQVSSDYGEGSSADES